MGFMLTGPLNFKKDLQTIIIDDFIWTVERTTKDVKLDPYATSCDVLRALNTRDDDFFILKEFRYLGNI